MEKQVQEIEVAVSCLKQEVRDALLKKYSISAKYFYDTVLALPALEAINFYNELTTLSAPKKDINSREELFAKFKKECHKEVFGHEFGKIFAWFVENKESTRPTDKEIKFACVHEIEGAGRNNKGESHEDYVRCDSICKYCEKNQATLLKTVTHNQLNK